MRKLTEKERAIHEEFSRYGRNAREWMNKCVMMLPMIERKRIWRKKGFKSIYEYAAKIAGMSRQKVDDALRVMRRIEDKPELMRVARVKGLNAVRPVATIASDETAGFWAGKAREMSRHALRTFVKDYRIERESGCESGGASEKSRTGPGIPTNHGLDKPSCDQKNEKVQISMKLDPEVLEKLKKLKGDGDWNEAMKKLLEYAAGGVEEEKVQTELAEARLQEELRAEKPGAVRTKSRPIPIRIVRYIEKRSGGICEHPNCGKRAEQIHHIDHFSVLNVHDPDRILHLCTSHHEIIHHGYLEEATWKQIEKLPKYDIRNLTNRRVLEFWKGT